MSNLYTSREEAHMMVEKISDPVFKAYMTYFLVKLELSMVNTSDYHFIFEKKHPDNAIDYFFFLKVIEFSYRKGRPLLTKLLVDGVVPEDIFDSI